MPSHTIPGIRVCLPVNPNERLMLDGFFGSIASSGDAGVQR